MAQRKMKGERRKDPRVKRGQHSHGYVLSGGVPWPELGDGTPWADSITRVTHRELPEETGTLQWVEWCHPGGDRMPDAERTVKATKTRPERARPGEWWCVVSWDRRDEHDSLMVRHPLKNVVPLDAQA